MKPVKVLFIVALQILSMACSAGSKETGTRLHALRAELVGLASAQFGDFQLCEIFSEGQDDSSFVATAISPKLLAAHQNIERNELHVKASDNSKMTHVGIVVITYDSADAAKSAMNSVENEGFLEGSKILTTYTLNGSGNAAILVYTESAADEFAGIVLEALSDQPQ